MRHRTTAVHAVALLGFLAVPAVAQNTAVASSAKFTVPADEVAAIRAATEKYKDISVAIAEGYLEHPMCMVAEMGGSPRQLGAMGYHYFRPDLLGITAEQPRVNGTGTHTDFLQPAILLYEPQADGSMVLTAIENLVWEEAWTEAGHDSPPEFHGNQYFHTIDNPNTEIDEAHGFEPHYELHWWLYRDNPAGAFSPWNAAVSCAAAGEEHHAAH